MQRRELKHETNYFCNIDGSSASDRSLLQSSRYGYNYTLNFEYTVDKTPDGRYVRIGRGSTSYYHTFLSEEIRDGITVVTVQFWADPSQTVPSRKVAFHLELIDGEYKPLHTVILEDSPFKTATAST